ncbi:MAG: hypothetical protein IPP48_03645 [Chitinophagaceae bacterium]|nr:hypothetical protein [Chitinophagaceae bacterium]
MKTKIIYLLLLTFCLAKTHAQEVVDSLNQYSKDTVGVFTKVDMEAQFAGGDTAWRNYLVRNLNVDKIAEKIKFKKNQKVVKEVVIVKFIVCKDGSLCEIKAENNANPLCIAEAERVIRKSPNWKPAQQNNRTVKAYRRQPITFYFETEY